MKKNMMRKNLRQSIKKSMGRYIAIVAIIALGAGLFCGLRVTKMDMVATIQDYTDDQNMFDLRLMNTYGWTGEDVLAFSAVSGIADAEGSISLDALLHFDSGEDNAYKLLSIPDMVNKINLNAGRLPQASDECLADGYYFDESVIGQTVYLSRDNDETTLENLAHDSYTIVGLTATPLYMNLQRGSTSIGNGSLSTYFYLPKEGFAMDVYTEISVTLAADYAVYTDEYDDAMDAMADILEPVAQPLAQQRFTDVVAEAEAEYDDGMREYLDGLQEYEDGKAEAEEELAKAEQELLDAEQQIADNRLLLEDGQTQLEDAEALLEDSLTTIAASRTELAQARTDAYAQIAQGYNELFANYKEVVSSQSQVEAGLTQLDAGISQIDSGLTQIESGLATIEVMLPILDIGISTAEATLEQLQDLTDDPDYQLKMEEAQAKLAEYTAKRDEYTAQKEALETTQAELTAQKEELEAQRETLLATQATLEAALDSINIGFMEAENAQLQAENQFAAAELQLDAAEAQIEANRTALEEKRTEIKDGLLALEEAQAQLNEGKEEFETEKARVLQDLADAETELEDARLQLQDAREAIDSLEEAEVYVLTRNTNIGYVVFESDSDIVAGVAKIFPAFFLAVAALVCITTMTRMVDEERTQIGTLKALGYSNGAIMSKYLAYSGSGAIFGCLAGVLIGSVMFPKILWSAYCIMYNFRDDITLRFDWSTIAFIVASYTALTLLVTWYCCRQSLKEVPAELIRPKAPTAGKQIFLEKLPVWKKLKFLDKVALRNIFRYRQRMAMMLLGIGGCTALLVTGFGINDSIADIVSFQFEEVTVYDIGVTFSEAQTQEQQEAFHKEFRGQADQILFCEQSGIDLEFGNSVKNVTFLAADKPLDGFVDLHDGDEPLAMPGRNEALVSIGAASSMGIEVGDTVTLRTSDLEELQVRISGIFNNNVYNYVVVSGQTLREQWNRSPEAISAFIVKSEQQEVHELGAELSGFEGVLSVSINQDTADTVGGMMDALDAVIVLIIFCAGLLASIVLYNLTNINIKERGREIATIKVLGFNAGETAAYVFKENLTLTAMGILVGLAFGKVLHTVVMSYVRIDMVWFDNRINWYSYIFAAVLTMLAAVIVDFIMYFQLDKINMAEALKSVE